MTEAETVEAHKQGRAHAAQLYVEIVEEAVKKFASTDERDAYLAGLTMELRRVAVMNSSQGRPPV